MAPVIIATDKTQLTQFSGNKSAYPVYLTVGNLPKAVRRQPSQNSCILIAYLSVEKVNRSKMTELEHRSRVQRIFHESMKTILEPLKQAGKDGVRMKDSKGAIRQVHPVLSCYVADYPEQCLVTCTKYGTCVKCCQDALHLEDIEPALPRTKKWTINVIQQAKNLSRGSSVKFHQHCMDNDVAGGIYSPFWQDFPYTDIHHAITPDVLHQLYQGVFKHVVEWCRSIVGEKELDRRIQVLPYGYGLRQFRKGISKLSQISGTERKNMAKILLGCVHDIMAPGGVKAVKALLDFIYLAQYSTHDQITLGYLRDSLEEFHKYKQYFVLVGCREHLNIPKLHSLIHYIQAIELFGTTDNYNTEMFERLHIDFAKQGWRASNQRDEFPQMITWLSRREKLISFHNSLHAQLIPTQSNPSKRVPKSIAKYPNYPNRSIPLIEQLHLAPEFRRHLKQYLNTFISHPLSGRSLDQADLPDLFTVNVYNMFRFQPPALQDNNEEADTVKAMPISRTRPHGRFDTVVVMDSDNAEATGMAGIV